MDNQLSNTPSAADLLPVADNADQVVDLGSATTPDDSAVDLLPPTPTAAPPSAVPELDSTDTDLAEQPTVVSPAADLLPETEAIEPSPEPAASSEAPVAVELSPEAQVAPQASAQDELADILLSTSEEATAAEPSAQDANIAEPSVPEKAPEPSPAYAATVSALRKSVSLIENELRQVKELLLSLGESAPTLSFAPKEAVEQGTVVEGVFDGEKMIAADGSVYNVPPNYASKSKLLEGDILKLNITLSGAMIFKQVRPIERKAINAVLAEDEAGNYWAVAGSRRWRLLTASVTYYKGHTGDEVAILVPAGGESRWAAVEYVRVKS